MCEVNIGPSSADTRKENNGIDQSPRILTANLLGIRSPISIVKRDTIETHLITQHANRVSHARAYAPRRVLHVFWHRRA